MSKFLSFLMLILVSVACGQRGGVDSETCYDPNTANVCPESDELNRYIEVPLFYDLRKNRAVIDRSLKSIFHDQKFCNLSISAGKFR